MFLLKYFVSIILNGILMVNCVNISDDGLIYTDSVKINDILGEQDLTSNDQNKSHVITKETAEISAINYYSKNDDTKNNASLPVGDIKFEESAKIETRGKKVNKTRKPVKLSGRQGFIMNQILGTYALSETNNSLCRAHVNEFKIGLRAFEPWALKMFDSSSKLMAGILAGNLAELGAFKQCLNIYEETPSGVVRGRHCTFRIVPTDRLVEIVLSYKNISKKKFKLLKKNVVDGSALYWSVCVPDSCNSDDVLRHYKKIILDLTDGLNLTIALDDSHCFSEGDLPGFTLGDYIYVLCVGLVLITSAICTVMDIVQEGNLAVRILNKTKHNIKFYEMVLGQTSKAVNLFSLRTNANILFSTSRKNDDIACLDGIRILTIIYVIIGHRYVSNMATPLINSLDLVEWTETYFATLIYGCTVTVDTFFFISGSLLSYNFLNVYSDGRKFNMPIFYLYRFFRLFMPLAFIVVTYATVLKHAGSGPLFNDFIFGYLRSCQLFWWSTILTIQPFVNPSFLCMVQTWSLTVDFFWYTISPVILLPLIRKPIIGFALLFAANAITAGTSFYIGWTRKINGFIPVSKKIFGTDYFMYYYIQPACRGSPYLLGLAFGYLLFKTKDRKIRLSLFARTAAWTLTSFFMPSVLFINRLSHLENYEYNRLFSSLFLTCHRWIWSLCVMWIVWSCHNGYGGIVDAILSYHNFKILGRLGYNMYLFHFGFQGVMQFSQKVPGYFSNVLVLYMAISDIVLSALISIPLAVLFEYPFMRAFGLLIKPNG